LALQLQPRSFCLWESFAIFTSLIAVIIVAANIETMHPRDIHPLKVFALAHWTTARWHSSHTNTHTESYIIFVVGELTIYIVDVT
jgi:hypothetical protein